MPRYIAYDKGGNALFTGETAPELGDKVAEKLDEQRDGGLMYTCEEMNPAFPYTVWYRSDVMNAVEGIPMSTLHEVREFWSWYEQ